MKVNKKKVSSPPVVPVNPEPQATEEPTVDAFADSPVFVAMTHEEALKQANYHGSLTLTNFYHSARSLGLSPADALAIAKRKSGL